MKQKSNELIAELIELTRQLMNEAEWLKTQPDSALNTQGTGGGWTALECMEHLNLYSRFYLPELERCISQSAHQAEDIFASGWLGNYFANSMRPREKLNKMKTFKDKNPQGRHLSREVLNTFVQDQLRMIELLNKARMVSLTRNRCGITISRWVRLKLGDTFRFVIYHNQRHLVQAGKAIPTSVEKAKPSHPVI